MKIEIEAVDIAQGRNTKSIQRKEKIRKYLEETYKRSADNNNELVAISLVDDENEFCSLNAMYAAVKEQCGLMYEKAFRVKEVRGACYQERTKFYKVRTDKKNNKLYVCIQAIPDSFVKEIKEREAKRHAETLAKQEERRKRFMEAK